MRDVLKSGIWYRTKKEGKWTDECFEFLPEEERMEILKKYDKPQLETMCKILAEKCAILAEVIDEWYNTVGEVMS